MQCNSASHFCCLDMVVNNLVHVMSTTSFRPLNGAWCSWLSRWHNATADWLAAQAMQARTASWGWLRPGPIPAGAQLVGWSDGSSLCGAAGSWGFVFISRGADPTEVVLEAIGGGYSSQVDSLAAECLGSLALSEALRLRVDGHDIPRHWGQCPADVWANGYARTLHQIRIPPTWAREDSHNINSLYNISWHH